MTSSAVKSATPQVATQLSDRQIEGSSATVTYFTPQLATTFFSGQINATTTYSSVAPQLSNRAVSPLSTLTSALITTS
jgi:hypothetical protein